MKCRDCIDDAIPGKSCCQRCLDRRKRLQKEYTDRCKANKMCTNCGTEPARDGKRTCQKCSEKASETARKRYERYRTLGVCTHCGKNKLPPNEYLCRSCRDQFNRNRKRREKTSPLYLSKLRDNFECKICGATSGLHTHHIDERGEREPTKKGGPTSTKRQTPNNEMNNLITLCVTCHGGITRFLHHNTQLAIDLLNKVK